MISAKLTLFRTIALVLCTLIGSVSGAGAATVDFWQFWTDPQIRPTLDSIAREFERDHPGTSIRLTDLTWNNGQEKIAISLASGSGPDLIELGADWLAQFADAGQLADLSAELSVDSSQFSGWQLATYQGKIYAMPWILGTRVLFGNRDLMNSTGGVYDSTFIPLVWEQLRVAAIYTGKVGPDTRGWGSNVPEKHRLYKKFLPFFFAGGGSLFTPDGRFCLLASDHGLEALNLLKQLHDSSSLIGDQRTIEDAFVAGKLGYVVSGDWLLKRIAQEYRSLNFFTTMIPGRRFPGSSILGGELLAVNGASKQKNEAISFLKYLTTPANQLRFCKAAFSTGPSSKSAQNDPYFTSDFNRLLFIRQLNNSVAPPVDPLWPQYEEIIERAVEASVFDDVRPGNALYQAKLEIEALRAARK